MKKQKIVKVVVGLVLVGGVAVGSFVCAQKEQKQEVSSTDGVIDGTFPMEFVTDSNGNIIGVESILGTETDNSTETEKDFVYDPMDFSKLEESTQPDSTQTAGEEETVLEGGFEADPNATPYENLIKERDFYYNHLVGVLKASDKHSKDDIAVAIYSVVRLDNDLSNLLVKMYKEKLKEVDNMKYYADQIETLEYVLTEMKNLQNMVEETENLYESYLSLVGRADKEQIKKVKKFTLTPLNEPIADLEWRIDDLKVLLEEALETQSQD